MTALFAVVVSACGQVRSDSGDDDTKYPRVIGQTEEPAEPAEVTDAQREDFGTLADYVGRSFKGVPTGGSTETFVDIQKWEWALGGKAILIRHVLEGGSYGGDTYVYKDGKSDTLTYVYITTGGYHTVGEMVPNENGWIAEEAVNGHDSITRVRSTSVVDDTGVWTMTSQYLTDGNWVSGHSFEYVSTSDPLPTITAE